MDNVKLIQAEDTYKKNPDGKPLWRCLLLSDATPAEMPVAGDTVTGMPDEAIIDSGSILIAVSNKKTYIMGAERELWFEGPTW